MKHSLEELKSGQLIGCKSLKLACGLNKFPEEILSLADTLEYLDLSDNLLTELPNSFSQLKNLKVLFFQKNNFSEFPIILAKLPVLSMIGFKANQIHTVPENAFPPMLKWLILTDNKIKKIPKSIGDCLLLQKLPLAGNLIEELPIEMTNCVNLELLRISANKLKSIPKWLFELPKLSWVAFGGNSFTLRKESNHDFEEFHWNDFAIKELLGEGASGMISKASWISKKEDVAVKIFKGYVTSDGFPEDEMAVSLAAGLHKNLIPVLGKIKEHPEKKIGLVMKLISSVYISLGNPPSLETCTRDIFDEQLVFSGEDLMKIAKSIASVSSLLHSKGINHGDLYAHNILISKNAECLLGDFGAASFYDLNSALAHNIERVEVRAFGGLLEDVFSFVSESELDNQVRIKWQKLITDCTMSDVKFRPSFSEVLDLLHKF